MVDSPQTFAEAKNAGHNDDLIRKILETIVLARPYDAAATPITEAIWDGTKLLLPAGYRCVGKTTEKDGLTWTRDQDVSEVTSHGYGEPSRRDIKKDTTGLKFTAQETNRLTMELDWGQDFSGVTPGAKGVLTLDKASRPASMKWEFLSLGKDGDGPDAIYVARWLPRAQVAKVGDKVWSSDDELGTELELASYVDKRVGTSLREMWFGPGLKHEAMGFPAPTP